MRMAEPFDRFAGGKRSPRPGLGLRRLLRLMPALVVVFFAAQPFAAQPQTGQPAPVQQAPGQQLPTIAKEVNVVNVLASVRDKHGQIIRNLTKDDFVLEEDGRPQTIRYFSRETDLPLTLGLLVDTSLSQRRVLDQERSASATFLDQVLRVGKDVAFVIHFDRQVELLQDITSDRQKLQAALSEIGTPELARADPSDPPGSSTGPSAGGPHRRGGFGGGGTLLYDAVYLASNEMMKNQQGRKAILVLSDGVDHGSQETLASAMEAAQRADTLVYSILFSDRKDTAGTAAAMAAGAVAAWAGWVAWAGTAAEAGRAAIRGRKRVRTARRFWSACPRRPAGSSFRSRTKTARPDFRPDPGGAAQPVQPGLHARPRGFEPRLPQDQPDHQREGPDRTGSGRILLRPKVDPASSLLTPARMALMPRSQRSRASRRDPDGAGEVFIPEKLYFRIGEVSKLTRTKEYVLRYWETEFPTLRPAKSSTGHRLYKRRDVELVLEIRRLLYSQGFTIDGARKRLERRSRLAAGEGQAEAPVSRVCGRQRRHGRGRPRRIATAFDSPRAAGHLKRALAKVRESVRVTEPITPAFGPGRKLRRTMEPDQFQISLTPGDRSR